MLANIIVVVVGVTFAYLLYFSPAIAAFFERLLRILSPFVVGAVIAFLIAPIVSMIERLLSRVTKPKSRLNRPIAMVISYLIALMLVTAFFAIVLPDLIVSVPRFINAAPGYLRALSDQASQLLEQYDIANTYITDAFGSWEQLAMRSLEYLGQQVPTLLMLSASISNGVTNLVMGFIISIYVLFGKEHLTAQCIKLMHVFTSGEHAATIIKWMRRSQRIFTRYVGGTLLNSLILGGLCYAGMTIGRMEYALLISVVVGVTNIIPLFGPFIGMLIGVVILLLVHPINALYFTIFILILQQVEGNIIGPRILGESIGISSIWIVLSIVLGGGLFGFMGMLVSIPIFALVYAIVESLTEARLIKRGLPPETDAYADPDRLPLPSDDAEDATLLRRMLDSSPVAAPAPPPAPPNRPPVSPPAAHPARLPASSKRPAKPAKKHR